MTEDTPTTPPTEGPLPEPLRSKHWIARHYGVSERWVEKQARLGMPSRLIGRNRRYLLSEVDRWLDERYGERAA